MNPWYIAKINPCFPAYVVRRNERHLRVFQIRTFPFVITWRRSCVENITIFYQSMKTALCWIMRIGTLTLQFRYSINSSSSKYLFSFFFVKDIILERRQDFWARFNMNSAANSVTATVPDATELAIINGKWFVSRIFSYRIHASKTF